MTMHMTMNIKMNKKMTSTRSITSLSRFARAAFLLSVAALALAWQCPADSASAAHAVDDVAVKKVVDGFSSGWNSHDASAMCASLADDVRWVSWRGEVTDSRKGVEEDHAKLFADLYKNTHRTDEVKSIRYLGPDLASVDDFWTMTGARTRDGADWPYRAGYANFLMARRDGRWIVIVSHTADFNAKGPAAH
jgi:uncharacterized protein (TIGR02246 family)